MPQTGQWQARHEAFGVVHAQGESQIKLPFSMRVTAVPVIQGQTVYQGEVILRFLSPRLQQRLSAYQQARTATGLAEKRLQVLRSNRKAHTITRGDLLVGEQALAAATANENKHWNDLRQDLAVLGTAAKRSEVNSLLDQDRQDLLLQKLSTLYAPFSGVVVNQPPAIGTWVSSGKVVLEVEDLGKVYVSVGIPQSELPEWHQGDTWLVSGTQRLVLHPISAIPRLDPDTGLRLLRFTTDNPENDLQDGQWVHIMHLSAPKTVLWVPASAVVSRNGKSWCLLVKGSKEKPTPVNVEAGEGQDGKLPILSGLKAGQAVLIKDAYEWLYRDLKDLIRFVD